jgi:hypothetical protein
MLTLALAILKVLVALPGLLALLLALLPALLACGVLLLVPPMVAVPAAAVLEAAVLAGPRGDEKGGTGASTSVSVSVMGWPSPSPSPSTFLSPLQPRQNRSAWSLFHASCSSVRRFDSQDPVCV